MNEPSPDNKNGKYLSLEELQDANLTLLREFDALCGELSLRYDLCGGTLLGAVRHAGFIPWDDDIDVSMPRPDYERLLELVARGAASVAANRKIVSNRDNTFSRHYARYVRLDLRRSSDYSSDGDCPFIGIDIFPHDGMPEDENASRRLVSRIGLMRRVLLLALSKQGISSRGRMVACAKDAIRPFICLIGPNVIARALDRTCQSVPFETAKFVGGISGMYGMKERWLKKQMLPQTEIEFCGCLFSTYKNYDLYLTSLYGNYMELPPVEHRIPHGDKAYWVSSDDRMGVR